MKRLIVDDLPSDPLGASGVFHQHGLHHVETILSGGDDVMLAFAPADFAHREWRRAIVAGLARKHTPRRINAVAAEGGVLDAFESYLANAPGVTGQYLEGDGEGAGNPAG